MKNAVQSGKILELTNGSGGDLLAGQGLVVGVNIGVLVVDIADGAKGSVAMEGVFEMEKTAAEVYAEGDVLYWDPATKKLTSVAGVLKKAGYAVEAAAGADAKAKVKLIEKV